MHNCSIALSNEKLDQFFFLRYVSQNIKGIELELEVLHERTYKNGKRKDLKSFTSEPTVAASLICKQKVLLFPSALCFLFLGF